MRWFSAVVLLPIALQDFGWNDDTACEIRYVFKVLKILWFNFSFPRKRNREGDNQGSK
jgi:hypothetical protein